VLAQIATNAKSNECPAVFKLLEFVSLKGSIVTADALNCQRDIAQKIVENEGDYVLALIGNHRALHTDVRLLLDEPFCETVDTYATVDRITVASRPAPRLFRLK
jgi:predicted transposase YbfD/YdcC